MKKTIYMAMAIMMFSAAGAGCADAQASKTPTPEETPSDDTQEASKVYMIREISSDNLVKIYEALGREPRERSP